MSLALYINLTAASGTQALEAKRSLRERLRREQGTATRIYRNPFNAETHKRYRFIRVHFTKDA